MSEHCNPDAAIARWTSAEQAARPSKPLWPDGATAGLALVAACCLAIGLTLYQFAGPREMVEGNMAQR